MLIFFKWSGYIDRGELRGVLRGYNEMREEEVKQMLQTLDENADGKIEYQGLWWFVVVFGGFWWFLVVFNDFW